MTHKEEFLSECIILDTETTGTDYNTAEIIEAGFVIRENNEWAIFQELHKPTKSRIPPLVESITYITNKMVENSPSFVESKNTFQAIIDGFMSGYSVAHNHFYDMKVLQNHGIIMPSKSICTWRIAKKIFNDIPEIENTNLPYLRFALELDVPIDLRCHRAGNDSFITGKLLEVMIDLLESTGVIDANLPYAPQLLAWLDAPIIYSKFPFGKHKGVPMEEVPLSYYQWALKNVDSLKEGADNYDPDLAASVNYTLELMLKKKF